MNTEYQDKKFVFAFEIIPNGKESAENFGMLKASLKKSGSRLDDFDLAIASCALAHNLTLVTTNLKRFYIILGGFKDRFGLVVLFHQGNDLGTYAHAAGFNVSIISEIVFQSSFIQGCHRRPGHRHLFHVEHTAKSKQTRLLFSCG